MVHDKIALLLKDVAKVKEKLKDIKKDMKQEEKIDDDDYLQLKKALKELKEQVKDKDDENMENLHTDDFYNQLRELRMKAEEELAHMNQKIFELIAQLPPKAFEIKMETDAGPVRVQIQPEMKIYLNGREEKIK